MHSCKLTSCAECLPQDMVNFILARYDDTASVQAALASGELNPGGHSISTEAASCSEGIVRLATIAARAAATMACVAKTLAHLGQIVTESALVALRVDCLTNGL